MEGQYESNAGQHAPRQRQEIDAQQVKVMEVNDVGSDQLEEFRERTRQFNARALVPEVIVFPAQEEELSLAPVEPGDLRAALIQGFK